MRESSSIVQPYDGVLGDSAVQVHGLEEPVHLGGDGRGGLAPPAGRRGAVAIHACNVEMASRVVNDLVANNLDHGPWRTTGENLKKSCPLQSEKEKKAGVCV